MKIGLMGLEFNSANKGCEALVYSFLSIINNIGDDDLTIYNFSGTSLGCVDEVFPDMKFINVYPKIKDFKFKYLKALRQCNFIFDATMGDSFSDIYSKDYFKHFQDEEYVFINAWNEWAEGMILEPTKENGDKYLSWIRDWTKEHE